MGQARRLEGFGEHVRGRHEGVRSRLRRRDAMSAGGFIIAAFEDS